MPRITAIKKQKKDGRANIYVDGAFSFGVDLETLIKTGLRIEQEYTEKELVEIKEKAETQVAFNKLLNFAMLRPRSYKEIYDWLYRKKVSEDAQNRLVSKLERLDLLDDEKFALWWVRQRVEFRPRSKRQIVSELLQKGVSNKAIQSVFDSVKVDETGSATKLLNKQMWRWQKLDEKARVRKQSEYLARKGFSWDTIREVVD